MPNPWLVETEVLHSSETMEVPYPSEKETPANTEVTLHTTTKVSATNDMEVTPSVETEVTATASTESFVHTYEEFPKGSSNCYVLTRYVNHVAFKL